MKQLRGWYVPDLDDQMKELLPEDGRYQGGHLDAAVAYCRRRRTVIDGGAHIGTWSRVFAGLFDRVISFEPSPDTFECLRLNVTAPNVELRNQAIGKKKGFVTMTLAGFEGTKRERNVGSRYAVDGGTVERINVDSLGLTDLDLLKLDIEGGEVHALLGARATLARCRPVVLFENKWEWRRHGYGQNAPHKILRDLGAVKLDQSGVDEIWGWKR